MSGIQNYRLEGEYICACGKCLRTVTALMGVIIHMDGSSPVRYSGPGRHSPWITVSDIKTTYFDGTERVKVKFDRVRCPECNELIDTGGQGN